MNKIIEYLGNKKFKLKMLLYRTRIAERLADRNALKELIELIDNENYIYEKEIDILPKLIHSNDVVFDIGANRGEYTYYLSKIVEEGKVYSFEPSSRAYHLLEQTNSHFGLSNVICSKIALSDRPSITYMRVPFFSRQAYMVSEEKKTRNDEEVKTTTLDLFVKEHNIQKIDFIKIDTEGAEYAIFSGANMTLTEMKPLLLVEVVDEHLQRFGVSVATLCDLLQAKGYEIYMYDFEKKKLMPVVNIITQFDGGVWKKKSDNLGNNNYFFIHESKRSLFKDFYL